MGIDIRLPIGLLFAILGMLLAVYGLVSDSALYDRSLGININLRWGVVLLLFGVLMVMLGRRGARLQGMRPASESVEGLATETREHQLGLERE